jgi:thiol-disulfide isomerase/thioredoxin
MPGGRDFIILIQPDGSKMIVGEIERDSLFAYFPEWEFEYKYYQPDPAVLDSMERYEEIISVEIFLGTWCSDSRREVPHFFKIIDNLRQSPVEGVTIWAVDRKKEIPESDIVEQRKIKRVATFIFYDDDEEIGRIVERPVQLFEADMLQILTQTER